MPRLVLGFILGFWLETAGSGGVGMECSLLVAIHGDSLR